MENILVLSGGVPPTRIKGDKDYVYETDITIPDKFIIQDVFVQVKIPVAGKKIAVGTKAIQDFFLRNIDVSTVGMKEANVLYDDKGNILDVLHGIGLCDTVTVKEPIMRKAKKPGDPDVKIGEKTIYKSYHKKYCNTAALEKVYIRIPKGCSMEDSVGGLKVKVFLVGFKP